MQREGISRSERRVCSARTCEFISKVRLTPIDRMNRSPGKKGVIMPTVYSDATEVCFEDLEIGDGFISLARTVTEADLVNFAAFLGWYDPLHCDAVSTREGLFGTRVAQGLLGLALSNGLCRGCFHSSRGRVAPLAFLGLNWRFKRPIMIGDTVHVEEEVLEKRETKRAEQGLVVLKVAVINQDGQVVQEGEKNYLVKRQTR
jgi:acyl dehydratase